MRLISSIIGLMALIGFTCLLSIIGGLLVGYWHTERVEAQEEPCTKSCNNCKHGDLEWDETPCDACCENEKWEANNAN